MHISQVTDRTAANLAEVKLHDDPYHKSIQRGAQRIVEELPATLASVLTYRTQWSSGSTLWSAENPATSYTVYNDGRVSKNYG